MTFKKLVSTPCYISHLNAIRLVLYGNAERAIIEVAHRIAVGQTVQELTDIRGTAFIRRGSPEG